MMAISSPAATWMFSSRGWKESSPMNSVSTARRSWPRSRSQRAPSPASSWMYSVSGSLLVTGSSCVALVTPERGHRRRVHRTWTDYTLDALDGPPATAPFVGKPDAASGGLRIGSLLTQERLGVLAGEAGHGKEFDASLTLGNRHRDRPVVHLGEFGGTSRTEGDHADASGFSKVLTSDRDLVAGLAFIRANLFDIGRRAGATTAPRQPRRFRGLGLVALNPTARLGRRRGLFGLLFLGLLSRDCQADLADEGECR